MERLTQAMTAAAAEPSPQLHAPSEQVLQASTGAVWGVVHRHVTQGRARQLPSLAGYLTFMLLAPILGPQQAVRAILDEHARMHAGAR